MRDDTALVEDAAAAVHVGLHRAEAWVRLAAARGVLLGEASVALAALATFEGSYTYGDPQTIQAATTAGQVCTADMIARGDLVLRPRAESIWVSSFAWCVDMCL